MLSAQMRRPIFLLVVAAAAVWSCRPATAANILFLSPHTSYSHSHLFHHTSKALASRGHTVTHWNGLAAREPVANLTYLTSRRLQNFNQMHDIGFGSNNNIFSLIASLPSRMASVCGVSYNDPAFQRLLNTHEKFDFIVLEAFMNECMLPFVDHFKVPFAYLSPVPPLPWMLDATCSPMSSHQLPIICTEFTDEMNVFQRAANALMGLFMIYYRRLFILSKVDEMAAKAWSNSNFTGPLRPVHDIEKEVTLFISNTQPTINYQFPTSSAIIHIGGLHIANAPSKPLPDEWESFASGSGDAGFIVMSFGTIVRGAGMPEATRKIFVSAFSRLPQRVLWKWEDKSGMPDLPANVKISPWLPPVNDLLSHPKAKLFMSHGGLYSNQEAMWFGVPLIGFPIFGDQTSYINKAVDDGYAMRIDWEYMTEETLYNGIVEMINNAKYKKRVVQLSQVMRDRVDLDQPLDRTVRSIEYVIRHKGGLKPDKCRLAIVQRELWDVTFLFALLAIAIAYGIVRATRPTRSRIYRLLRRNSVVDIVKKNE